MQFQRATRRKTWLKVALTGASGSGKTYSALQLAFGLGKRVAIVDTENGSGSLYAHLGEYDALELGAPFTTERYEEAIRAAVSAGFDVLILDSLSHAWAGTGGLLAQKEMLDARDTGRSFQNWAPITKKHEAFKAAILEAPLHIIATMRSKEDHVLTTDERGKPTVRKAGMAPIQRDGMSYEFTIVFDINASDHRALATKDRTSLFAEFHGLLSSAHGRTIAEWLDSGAEPLPAPQPTAVVPEEHATAPVTASKAKTAPTPHPRRAEQWERWLKLKAEAEALGVSVEPFRPTKDTAVDDADALLTGLETLLGEVRERQAQEKAA